MKPLAKGTCQSLFITYSLSMKAMMRSFMCCRRVWLSKQQLRDIRADEASVPTEMTTFWQLKTRWLCFLLTSSVTTLNYTSHWFGLRWNVSLCLPREGCFTLIKHLLLAGAAGFCVLKSGQHLPTLQKRRRNVCVSNISKAATMASNTYYYHAPNAHFKQQKQGGDRHSRGLCVGGTTNTWILTIRKDNVLRTCRFWG